MERFAMKIVWTVAVAVWLSGAATTAQSVVTVPDDAATVEQAMKQVNAGGTIRIRQGTHNVNEMITIDKDVTIVAESGNPKDTILRNPQEETSGIFCIWGGNVRIEALSLISQHPIDPRKSESDIQVDNTAVYVNGKCQINLSIVKCHISANSGLGLHIEAPASRCVIEKSVFRGNYGTALAVLRCEEVVCKNSQFCNGQTDGIDIEQGKVVLEKCKISGNMNGLYIYDDAVVTVRGCTISKNREYGVQTVGGASGTFVNNKLFGNRRGNWSLMYGGRNIVHKNNWEPSPAVIPPPSASW